MPARRHPRVKNGRPGPVVGQFPLDLPNQLLALVRIGLGRLPFDQSIRLGAAIPIGVKFAAAAIVEIEAFVRIIGRCSRIMRDGVVLAQNLGKPVRSCRSFKLAIDVDLLQLVDAESLPDRGDTGHRGWITLTFSRLSGPVAKLLHDLPRLARDF